MVGVEELGRGWGGAADISAGWPRDEGGLGSGGIEAAALCTDVAEDLVKGMDGGTPDSMMQQNLTLLHAHCRQHLHAPRNHNHFLPYI